jgi:hypothetical protein
MKKRALAGRVEWSWMQKYACGCRVPTKILQAKRPRRIDTSRISCPHCRMVKLMGDDYGVHVD